MNILGISCFYHDSAACLIRDGEIIAAAQEERFSRKKHDPGFPGSAIEYCLKRGNISIADLDYAAFYDKPLTKFERIVETYLAFAPKGLHSFLSALPVWLGEKLWIKEYLAGRMEGFGGEILFAEHHESHAASAFYPSPFDEAAFLTVDGVGEWATTSFGTGKANSLTIDSELRFPHSLGLLYSAFTYYLGFKVNSGEYKVMGLAPYGEPRYVRTILDNLIDLKKDGSFRLNMSYFNYCTGLTMTNENFHRLFGTPPRNPETAITRQMLDIAASIQEVTNRVMIVIARHVRRATGRENLCLAGGVALNCVANTAILKERLFNNIWVQPAAGDAGGALGAALLVYHRYLGLERHDSRKRDGQKGSYLGPEYSDDEIGAYLREKEIPYTHLPAADVPAVAARLIEQGRVVGWFQGRMEFGPRALGARSIVGDPRLPEMQRTMNLKIKFRESFRPFAPAVLKEHAAEFFDIEGESPYMLFVADVRKEKRSDTAAGDAGLTGIDQLRVKRSEIPSVTHVDYSARLQTVDKADNPLFYELIREFHALTGCPVIINTSFNVRGEPIVCSPADAYRCFMRTGMDNLVMGNFILDKKEQPAREQNKRQGGCFPPD